MRVLIPVPISVHLCVKRLGFGLVQNPKRKTKFQNFWAHFWHTKPGHQSVRCSLAVGFPSAQVCDSVFTGLYTMLDSVPLSTVQFAKTAPFYTLCSLELARQFHSALLLPWAPNAFLSRNHRYRPPLPSPPLCCHSSLCQHPPCHTRFQAQNRMHIICVPRSIATHVLTSQV